MLNISPISGLIAAVVGCVLGGAIIIYTEIQCAKDKKEIDEIMEDFKEKQDHINDILK